MGNKWGRCATGTNSKINVILLIIFKKSYSIKKIKVQTKKNCIFANYIDLL